MKAPIIVIGIGEMGGVFARGFLRAGHPVYPLTRDMDMNTVATEVSSPALVLIAAAERDVHAIMSELPTPWQDRVGLLQNELLPRDWQQHDLDKPTVVSVWFEKKKGQDAKVIIPSPVYGPGAALIQEGLTSIGIDVRVLDSEQQLLQELVLKNVYILTTNICGLVTGGNVGELWEHHRELARAVANEVIDIQEWLTGTTLDRAALIDGMVGAFEGDLQHRCMGRSAPARLERALKLADEAELTVPKMREIRTQSGGN